MEELEKELEPGGQMSFLEHLDELRKRLVTSVIIIVIAFTACWFLSGKIYQFLSVPIRKALSEAARSELPQTGITGQVRISPLEELKVGDTGRYVFDRATNLGSTVVSPGASVLAEVAKDSEGKLGLFTTEPLITSNAIVPKGVRLPIKFEELAKSEPNADERMIVTTA